MNFVRAGLAITALLSGGVEARKRLVGKDNNPITTPNVRATVEIEPTCIFGQYEKSEEQETHDYWCLDFTEPHIQVGWKFEQKYSATTTAPVVNYYMFQFQPYIQGYFYMKSLFDLTRIYFNEFIMDMPKFKTLLFGSSIFNSDFKWCYGLGWESENIKLSVQMKQ